MLRSIHLGFLSLLLFGSSSASLGGMWGELKSLSDWTPAHDIEHRGETAEELRFRSTELDPYLISRPIQFSTALYQAIVIEMSVTAGTEAQLFWATQESPNFNETMSHRFSIHPDGQWHQYTLSLAHHPHWTGKITRLRLDPTDNEADIRLRVFQVWDRIGPVVRARSLTPVKPFFSSPEGEIQARFRNAGDSPATVKLTWNVDSTIQLQSGNTQSFVLGPDKTLSATQALSFSQQGAFPVECIWEIVQGNVRDYTITSGSFETLVQYTEPVESSSTLSCESENARLCFHETWAGFGLTELQVKRNNGWETIGWMPHLTTIVWKSPDGEATTWCAFAGPPEQLESGAIRFEAGQKYEGKTLRFSLDIHFDNQHNVFRMKHSLHAPGAEIMHFSGPKLYIDDSAFGDSGREGIFPGVEYLDVEAISSSPAVARHPVRDQFVPNPDKITVPFQILSGSETLVALYWPANAPWGVQQHGYSPLFSSPNHWHMQDNHLMGLMLPTVPDFVNENTTLATTPYPAGDEPLVIESSLSIGPGGDPSMATRTWLELYAGGAFPDPIAAPRTYAESTELSRAAYMETCWDESANGWGHCVGWDAYPSGGMLVLLDVDARLEENGAERQAIEARKKQVYSHIVDTQGAFGLGRNTGCHVMVLEPVFHWGVAETTLDYWKRKAKGFQSIQNDDGSWGFYPDQPHQKELGDDGQVASGTISRTASYLLEVARINGDPVATEVGLRGVDALNRFRVPKGGQAWECPIDSADILVAAKASRANLDAYQITGDKAYLDMATYWARTGFPFLYLWNYEETPLQRYASIPIFGTSFFQVNWRGVPVQWCGLDYAYTLQLLSGYDSSEDWLRIARGIVNSGLLQQMTEGPYKGTLPDSYADRFSRPKSAFINPENIMTNLHALEGNPFWVRTVFPFGRGADKLRISANAELAVRDEPSAQSFSVDLSGGIASTIELLIAPLEHPPEAVLARHSDRAAVLQQRDSLFEQPSGWRYVPDHKTLLVHVSPGPEGTTLVVQGAH